MFKSKFNVFLFIILSAVFANANAPKLFSTPLNLPLNFKCTHWTAQNGISCLMAGSFAPIYARQCENPCWKNSNGGGNWGPNCDMEQVCSLKHPGSFTGKCSEWIAERSLSCFNPSTNKWEQRWVRACTVGLREDWCSDTDPN